MHQAVAGTADALERRRQRKEASEAARSLIRDYVRGIDYGQISSNSGHPSQSQGDVAEDDIIGCNCNCGRDSTRRWRAFCRCRSVWTSCCWRFRAKSQNPGTAIQKRKSFLLPKTCQTICAGPWVALTISLIPIGMTQFSKTNVCDLTIGPAKLMTMSPTENGT